MSDPTGAIPFADLRLGEIVWTCEHSNGADHNAHATFNYPPRQPRAMIVTEPQAAQHKNVFLAAIAPDTGKPIRDYDSSVTLYAPSRQFAFRGKAACDAYYREAVAQWAQQTREAVNEALRDAYAYLEEGGVK